VNFLDRQKRVQQQLAEQALDGLIVTHLPNIRYLTGFTGSAAIAVAATDETLFISDKRYTLQASQQVKARIIASDVSHDRTAADAIKEKKLKRLGFESRRMSCHLHRFFTEQADSVELVPTDGVVESLRLIKDDHELQAIRRAVELTSAVFSGFIGEIKPGRSERDLAAELEYRLRHAGAEKIAFETIIASGARAALPHGIASDKRIGYNEFVILDFGAIVDGYSSDMTRTVYVGTPDAHAKRIYNIVLEAQLNCEQKMQAGMKAEEVDALTRSLIAARGYDDYYWHSTGHGIGLEVHEAPRLGKNSETVVPAGSVVTVEPGIYLPDWGGVRIEDVVVVGPRGTEVLTPSPKELMALS
jgi:Xaa-Pro aminopeptidase